MPAGAPSIVIWTGHPVPGLVATHVASPENVTTTLVVLSVWKTARALGMSTGVFEVTGPKSTVLATMRLIGCWGSSAFSANRSLICSLSKNDRSACFMVRKLEPANDGATEIAAATVASIAAAAA